MHKRLLICLILGLALALFLLLRPKEPTFAGRPLTEWMALTVTMEGGSPGEIAQTRQHAMAILRDVGPNELPTIVEWATAVDRQAARSTRQWLNVVPLVRLKTLPADDQNLVGAALLRQIGARAEGAVPLLIRNARCEQDQPVRLLALSALGGLGRHAAGAVPDLVALLDAEQGPIREAAAGAVGEIGQRPEIALRRLLADLKGDPKLSGPTIAYALAGFQGPEALAGLSQLATNPEPATATTALFGLWRQGPEALLPVTLALTNANPRVQAAAFATLKLIWAGRPVADGYAMRKQAAQFQIDCETWESQLRSPRSTNLVVPLLLTNLSHADPTVRRLSAGLLSRYGASRTTSPTESP